MMIMIMMMSKCEILLIILLITSNVITSLKSNIYHHQHHHYQTNNDRSIKQYCNSINNNDIITTETTQQQSIFIFGLGYVGCSLANSLINKGWKVSGTCTNVKKIQMLNNQGIKAYLFDDYVGKLVQKDAIDDLMSSTHILSTIAPTETSNGDPVLLSHGVDLRRASVTKDSNLKWVGYVSSTGVYGDRGGAWVNEDEPTRPDNAKTKARTSAEEEWKFLHDRSGLPVHIFRLAGIYGPGRSALDTLRKYKGDMSQCGADDQLCISRIHVSDIVQVLLASMENPSAGTVLNVADDLPSSRFDVLSYACRLLNVPVQSPDRVITSSGKVKGNRGGSKRVDNNKMRKLLERLGKDMIYPDYRSGLTAIYEGDPVALNFLNNIENTVETEEASSYDNNNEKASINNTSTKKELIIEALEKSIVNQSILLKELNALLNTIKMDI